MGNRIGVKGHKKGIMIFFILPIQCRVPQLVLHYIELLYSAAVKVIDKLNMSYYTSGWYSTIVQDDQK